MTCECRRLNELHITLELYRKRTGATDSVSLDLRVRFRYSRLKAAALFAAGAMGFQSIAGLFAGLGPPGEYGIAVEVFRRLINRKLKSYLNRRFFLLSA